METTRTAVVTGAAGGLGQVFVRHLVASGWRVIATDRTSCAALVDELGQSVLDFPCDLAEPDDIDGFARKVLESVGAVDALVNNAAFIPFAAVGHVTPQLFAQVMQINVGAAMQLAQAFAPSMRARGLGRIVNLASSTVWGPPPGMSAYAASKMAVIGMTRALAAELSAEGITVNAISPGLTRHPGSAAALPDAAFDAVRARQFIQRTQQPSDLTSTLTFLLAPESGFVTGQVINVDGGGFGF
jgi:NAD(P)-dependent dehydrogenase (short-subunit alcohol dehydrogenase family)